MKAIWLTDIHLNFLSLSSRDKFFKQLGEHEAEVILISGDIGEAPCTALYMDKCRQFLRKEQKLYFVAGNHDYYGGEIEPTKQGFKEISHGQIHYLPCIATTIHLTEKTIIVGIDGWADGRYGNYKDSPVVLNDSYYIEDLEEHNKTKESLLDKMQRLADSDAALLKLKLEMATSMPTDNIIVLTHIPPFPESSLYQGKVADDNYLPFYGSRATGEVLLAFAEEYPNIDFYVFCGHSHNRAFHMPRDNLIIKTGEATYCEPKIEEILEIQ